MKEEIVTSNRMRNEEKRGLNGSKPGNDQKTPTAQSLNTTTINKLLTRQMYSNTQPIKYRDPTFNIHEEIPFDLI